MTLAEVQVKRSVILMELLGPDTNPINIVSCYYYIVIITIIVVIITVTLALIILKSFSSLPFLTGAHTKNCIQHLRQPLV